MTLAWLCVSTAAAAQPCAGRRVGGAVCLLTRPTDKDLAPVFARVAGVFTPVEGDARAAELDAILATLPENLRRGAGAVAFARFPDSLRNEGGRTLNRLIVLNAPLVDSRGRGYYRRVVAHELAHAFMSAFDTALEPSERGVALERLAQPIPPNDPRAGLEWIVGLARENRINEKLSTYWINLHQTGVTAKTASAAPFQASCDAETAFKAGFATCYGGSSDDFPKDDFAEFVAAVTEPAARGIRSSQESVLCETLTRADAITMKIALPYVKLQAVRRLGLVDPAPCVGQVDRWRLREPGIFLRGLLLIRAGRTPNSIDFSTTLRSGWLKSCKRYYFTGRDAADQWQLGVFVAPVGARAADGLVGVFRMDEPKGLVDTTPIRSGTTAAMNRLGTNLARQAIGGWMVVWKNTGQELEGAILGLKLVDNTPLEPGLFSGVYERSLFRLPTTGDTTCP